jgi:hypothetical protein
MSKKSISADLPENHLVVFQERGIRRTWHNAEWWFSVIDVCGVLTESAAPGAYWRKLKRRLGAEGGEVVKFCHGLKLEAPNGKQRMTDCANAEGLFRIVQPIPSPRAEPFKRWLAQVGDQPKQGRVGLPVGSQSLLATSFSNSINSLRFGLETAGVFYRFNADKNVLHSLPCV